VFLFFECCGKQSVGLFRRGDELERLQSAQVAGMQVGIRTTKCVDVHAQINVVWLKTVHALWCSRQSTWCVHECWEAKDVSMLVLSVSENTSSELPNAA